MELIPSPFFHVLASVGADYRRRRVSLGVN